MGAVILCVTLMLSMPMVAQVQAQGPAVQLNAPSFASAVYVSDSSTTARPLLGAKVFVTSVSQQGADWIGPEFTDPYGRFAFYGLAPGRYLLRIYDANDRRIWQQTIEVPSVISRIVIRPAGP